MQCDVATANPPSQQCKGLHLQRRKWCKIFSVATAAMRFATKLVQCTIVHSTTYPLRLRSIWFFVGWRVVFYQWCDKQTQYSLWCGKKRMKKINALKSWSEHKSQWTEGELTHTHTARTVEGNEGAPLAQTPHRKQFKPAEDRKRDVDENIIDDVMMMICWRCYFEATKR